MGECPTCKATGVNGDLVAHKSERTGKALYSLHHHEECASATLCSAVEFRRRPMEVCLHVHLWWLLLLSVVLEASVQIMIALERKTAHAEALVSTGEHQIHQGSNA